LASLLDIPADPRLSLPQMVAGRAPAEQGHPLTIDLGHVTQLFAHQARVLEVMLLFDFCVPPGSLLSADQAHLNSFQHQSLCFIARKEKFVHRATQAEAREFVPQKVLIPCHFNGAVSGRNPPCP